MAACAGPVAAGDEQLGWHERLLTVRQQAADLQRDEPALGERTMPRPELLDDADLVVGNPSGQPRPSPGIPASRATLRPGPRGRIDLAQRSARDSDPVACRACRAPAGSFRQVGAVSSRAAPNAMDKTRQFTAVIEREDDMFVALCPELDIASQGATVEEARDNLVEAIELFFESASPEEAKQRLHDEVFVTRVEVRVA